MTDAPIPTSPPPGPPPSIAAKFPPPEQDAAAVEPPLNPAAKRLRLVIAEDEAIIRLDLKETLTEMGYDVVADVGNGAAALEKIRSERPDLAILDIKMGQGLTGLEVAREVDKEHLCGVLILTAFSQTELITEAAGAGVMNYLVKPFRQSSLQPAIDIAYARFAQDQAVRDEVATLQEQLAVRKIVDRAKGKLMDEHGLSESEAFQFVQKTAMKQRLSMKRVAEMIVDEGFSPPSDPSA